MRNSKNFSLLLDSVNAGAVGLMIYALYPLGKISFADPFGILIFFIAGLIVLKFPKVSSIKLVGLGILLGVLSAFIKPVLNLG